MSDAGGPVRRKLVESEMMTTRNKLVIHQGPTKALHITAILSVALAFCFVCVAIHSEEDDFALKLSSVRKLEEQGAMMLLHGEYRILGDSYMMSGSILVNRPSSRQWSAKKISLIGMIGFPWEDQADRHLLGLRPLGDLCNIEIVDLTDKRVGDEMIDILLALSKLKYAGLSGTHITDHGLFRLASHPAIKVVDVHRSTVSAEGVSRFRAARPDVSVHEWYH